MSAQKSVAEKLQSDYLPHFIVTIGAVMLGWLFLGDQIKGML